MGAIPSQSLIDEFVAAAHGDFEKVKRMLEEYPLLVAANASWNERAIEAAAQTGRVDIVEHLLTHGAQLEICTAAVMGKIDHVSAFLDQDPEQINATGAHGIPLLYFAVIQGYLELAELLLERGVDINAGAGGNTALHGAVIFGRTEMVTWLLENGANIYLLDYNGKTPLQIAEENKQEEILAVMERFEK